MEVKCAGVIGVCVVEVDFVDVIGLCVVDVISVDTVDVTKCVAGADDTCVVLTEDVAIWV